MGINYKAIGYRIRILRKSQNITQAELSEKSGVEPSNISHIERGVAKVSLPTLLKIANAFSVSLDDLVYENLKKNSHVSIKKLNEILLDCTDKEIESILEIVKTTKNILRNR